MPLALHHSSLYVKDCCRKLKHYLWEEVHSWLLMSCWKMEMPWAAFSAVKSIDECFLDWTGSSSWSFSYPASHLNQSFERSQGTLGSIYPNKLIKRCYLLLYEGWKVWVFRLCQTTPLYGWMLIFMHEVNPVLALQILLIVNVKHLWRGCGNVTCKRLLSFHCNRSLIPSMILIARPGLFFNNDWAHQIHGGPWMPALVQGWSNLEVKLFH